jgi:hypothetical protein
MEGKIKVRGRIQKKIRREMKIGFDLHNYMLAESAHIYPFCKRIIKPT